MNYILVTISLFFSFFYVCFCLVSLHFFSVIFFFNSKDLNKLHYVFQMRKLFRIYIPWQMYINYHSVSYIRFITCILKLNDSTRNHFNFVGVIFCVINARNQDVCEKIRRKLTPPPTPQHNNHWLHYAFTCITSLTPVL